MSASARDGEDASVNVVYRSPRGSPTEDVLQAIQQEYDPWAPALDETPCSPSRMSNIAQTPAVFWDASASPRFAPESEYNHSQYSTQYGEPERVDDIPDHPCNYCHLMHWYSGPRATSCPAGTRLPRANRHSAGHNRRGRRQHLPETECTKCGQHHWCSGARATPCDASSLDDSRRRVPPLRRHELPLPKHACRRCRAMHYITGPWKSPCRKDRGKPKTAHSPSRVNRGTTVTLESHVKIEDEEHGLNLPTVPWHNQTSSLDYSQEHSS